MHGDWPLPPTLILNADSPGCLELFERLTDWPGRIIRYSVEGMSSLAEKTALLPSKSQGEHWAHDVKLDEEAVDVGAGLAPALTYQSHDVKLDGEAIDVRAGLAPAPTYQACDVKLDGETSFRVRSQDDEAFPAQRIIRLQLPGAYNIQNALAAITAARAVGIDAEVIVRTLEGFGGIRRRFELRHQGPLLIGARMLDVVLVDDYAHHPTAIASVLEAARRRYPGRRLVAVYQPHMFSRTKTFFEQFLHSFDLADVTLIADIFPGREHDTGFIAARDLVEAIAKRPDFSRHGRQVMHSGGIQATMQVLEQILCSGDVVLIMGAGDIYIVTEMLLQNMAIPGESA